MIAIKNIGFKILPKTCIKYSTISKVELLHISNIAEFSYSLKSKFHQKLLTNVAEEMFSKSWVHIISDNL